MSDHLQILQTIFTGFAVVVAIVAVALAYSVGKKQNEINAQVLGIQDFAEIFLMPQHVIDSNQQHVGWNLLIKNASSYPIYMNKYTLNDQVTLVGSSVVPTHSDSWYTVPIPKDVSEFKISVEFQDHRGKKYITEGNGKLQSSGWSIHSTPRVNVD